MAAALAALYPSILSSVSPLPLSPEACYAPVDAAIVDDLFGGFVDRHFHTIMPPSFPHHFFFLCVATDGVVQLPLRKRLFRPFYLQ